MNQPHNIPFFTVTIPGAPCPAWFHGIHYVVNGACRCGRSFVVAEVTEETGDQPTPTDREGVKFRHDLATGQTEYKFAGVFYATREEAEAARAKLAQPVVQVPFVKELTVLYSEDSGPAEALSDLQAISSGVSSNIIRQTTSDDYVNQVRLELEKHPELRNKIVLFFQKGTDLLEIDLTEKGENRWPVGFLERAWPIETAITEIRHPRAKLAQPEEPPLLGTCKGSWHMIQEPHIQGPQCREWLPTPARVEQPASEGGGDICSKCDDPIVLVKGAQGETILRDGRPYYRHLHPDTDAWWRRYDELGCMNRAVPATHPPTPPATGEVHTALPVAGVSAGVIEGTFVCPICGWDVPHYHSPDECAERPYIDGSRSAFEQYVQLASLGLIGDLLGPGRAHRWPDRMSPSGPYEHKNVELLWQLWRTAWMKQVPTPPATGEAAKAVSQNERKCSHGTKLNFHCNDCWKNSRGTNQREMLYPTPPATPDLEIKRMVERFLGWQFPDNFNPDGGISFKRMHYNEHLHPMPVGTNLLDADQAEEMVRYMLHGSSAPAGDVEQAEL